MQKLFSQKLFLLFLALWIIKGIVIALITPTWQGEDELSHHAYADLLARTNKWGVYDQLYMSDELYQAWQLIQKSTPYAQVITQVSSTEFKKLQDVKSDQWISTAYQPPLYYWLLAKILQTPPVSALNIVHQALVLRMISVLISAATIIVAHGCFQQLQTSRAKYLISMSLVTLNPQFSFLNSMINVDVAIICIWTCMWYVMVQISMQGWTTRNTISIAGLLTVGMLIKQSVMFVLPALSAMLLHAIIKKELTKKTLISMGIIAVITALSIVPEYYNRSKYTLFLTQTPTHLQSSIGEYLLTQTSRVARSSFTGFFQATHGLINYQASDGTIVLLKMLVILSIIGLIDILRKQDKKNTFFTKPKPLQLTALLVFTWIAFLIAWDYQNWQRGVFWIKGRYLFPLMIPLMYAIAHGLMHIFPARYHRYLALAIPLIIAWAQVQTLLWFSITLLYI